MSKKSFKIKKTITRIGDVQSLKFDEDGKKIEEVRVQIDKFDVVVLASTLENLNELMELKQKTTFTESIGFLLDMGSILFTRMKEE